MRWGKELALLSTTALRNTGAPVGIVYEPIWPTCIVHGQRGAFKVVVLFSLSVLIMNLLCHIYFGLQLGFYEKSTWFSSPMSTPCLLNLKSCLRADILAWSQSPSVLVRNSVVHSMGEGGAGTKSQRWSSLFSFTSLPAHAPLPNPCSTPWGVPGVPSSELIHHNSYIALEVREFVL